MALLAANVLGGSTAPAGVEAWVVTEGGALQLTAMVVAVVGLGFLEELEVAPGTPLPEETGVVGLLTEGRDLGGPIIPLPEGVGGADFATAVDVVLLGPALCKRSLMRPSFWWPFPPLPLLAFPGEDEGVVVLEGDVSGVGVGLEGAAVEVAGLLVELIFFRDQCDQLEIFKAT